VPCNNGAKGLVNYDEFKQKAERSMPLEMEQALSVANTVPSRPPYEFYIKPIFYTRTHNTQMLQNLQEQNHCLNYNSLNQDVKNVMARRN